MTVGVDPFDVGRARQADGQLAAFNEAGVLAAADVHVAQRLGLVLGEERPDVVLACALAVRAPRLGHVCANLATAGATVTTDVEAPVDLAALPWPEPEPWLAAVASSPLVGAEEGDDRPLRLEGSRLYLDRYWRQERRVAADLLARAAEPAGALDEDVLGALLDSLFPEPTDVLPRRAAEVAARRRLAVVAGGPGTGKTTTVARLLGALDAATAAAGRPPLRFALAAPTGKAAARLEQAVHQELGDLEVPAATAARIRALRASTIHRLLGWRPDSRSRFRHHRHDRLPHDVVVVDETSMVSLSLMAALVEAVRAGARLVLVGDPDQLASVEAGAVLGDVVAPAGTPGSPLAGNVVRLTHVHRYRGEVARLAGAVQAGDADAAIAVLRGGRGNVRWISVDVAEESGSELAPVRKAVLDAGLQVAERARAGDADGALGALGRMRLLCAHRRGPYGAARWAAQVERWLAAAAPEHASGERWYAGRPLLVTANDHALRLYNGDTGVVVAGADDRLVAAFGRSGDILRVSPTRLAAVETVHAMTIHKSQGSQFDEVAVVLPHATSPLLTRELLYTAITRARDRLTVVGTESGVRAAVARPIARASGLADRLR